MIEAPEDVYSELALPLELIDTGILRNYSLVKPILKSTIHKDHWLKFISMKFLVIKPFLSELLPLFEGLIHLVR